MRSVGSHRQGLAGHSQHAGDARAIKIDIQQADFRALARKREGQIDGRHAFADSAFAAHHDQLVLDPGHAGLHLPHLVGDLLNDLRVVRIFELAQDGF